MTLKEAFELFKYYLGRTFGEDGVVKLTGSIFTILFGNDKILAFLVLFLILFDFDTGVVKAKVKNEEIKSHKFRNTVLKIYIYYSLIMTLGVVDYMMGANVFLRIGYAFIGLTEGKSILENLIQIHPPLKEINEKLKWWKSNGNSSKTSQS